jgi:hypothetical protein
VWGIVVFVVFVAAGAGSMALNKHRHAMLRQQQTAHVAQYVQGTIPKFKTILPAGENIQSLGGWQAASPGQTAAYSYTDKIGPSLVTVTEQPLPTDISEDPAIEVAVIVKSLQASHEISRNGITVYLVTSKTGIQSAIFTKAQLLVLIKSAAVLTDAQWLDYVDNLR